MLIIHHVRGLARSKGYDRPEDRTSNLTGLQAADNNYSRTTNQFQSLGHQLEIRSSGPKYEEEISFRCFLPFLARWLLYRYTCIKDEWRRGLVSERMP